MARSAAQLRAKQLADAQRALVPVGRADHEGARAGAAGQAGGLGVEVQDAGAVDFAQRRFAPRNDRIDLQRAGACAAAKRASTSAGLGDFHARQLAVDDALQARRRAAHARSRNAEQAAQFLRAGRAANGRSLPARAPTLAALRAARLPAQARELFGERAHAACQQAQARARGSAFGVSSSLSLVEGEDRAHAGRAAGAAIAAFHQFARAREQFGLAPPQAVRSGPRRPGSCRRGTRWA
jgi:hypothetical protein